MISEIALHSPACVSQALGLQKPGEMARNHLHDYLQNPLVLIGEIMRWQAADW